MLTKKYEITDETKVLNGRTLHRIQALKNIGWDVKKGDMGGWIETKRNLSQNGDAWVYDSAMVCGDAVVSVEAQVCCNAQLFERTDVLTIGPIGSRDDITTFYKTESGVIYVKCGCKNTDIDTWLKMVNKTHGDNRYGRAYKLAAEIAKLQILGEEE